MFRIKVASGLLIGVLALSLGAERVQAGWHHWGCHSYYPYSYSYVTVYSPVVYAPVYRHWPVFRPHLWRYGGCYGSSYYYAPAYATYGNCCYGTGYAISPYYSVAPDCCGGAVIQSYQSTDIEPSPADSGPVLPPPPEPGPRSVIPRSVPDEPMSPDPADDPPALPPDPDSVLPPVPDAVAPPDPTPALPLLPNDEDARRQPRDSAILAVHVPADARVYVNGMLTKTPGTVRQYVSRGLSPGHDYTYEVRVELTLDGRTYAKQQTANLRAGGNAQLAFRMDRTFAPVANRGPVETSLTLHVPETAQVTLEGRSTGASGAVRTFTTRELRDGERWEAYRVVVELERDGRVETRERAFDLVGGESHEFSIDFGPERVALR